MMKLDDQIEKFRKGFPWMKIIAPATPERGITVLSEDEVRAAAEYADKAPMAGKCKFVPASGAATRMFKDIFKGLDTLESGSDIEPGSPAYKLTENIDKFAFYTEALFGPAADTPEWRRSVLSKVLTPEGLSYGTSPKGVVLFHRYPTGEVRTAIAEHLVEAQEYMKNPDGTCRIVVTVSPEHENLFRGVLDAIVPEFEKRYGVKYEISLVFQDKATDTVAVDLKNRPFHKEDGTLLMRPAGHGALIYNLDKIEDEVVSIKNIDNVAVESLLPVTAMYKKALMGTALKLRDRIFGYLKRFDEITDTSSAECHVLCNEVEDFLDRKLCIQVPLTRSRAERAALLRAKLDRPVRVCGMVRNQGEPGGGPFIISGKDGCSSLQILESVQINKEDPGAAGALSRSTHFNPVDLVCCLKNYKGEKFNLLDYVDEDAGFISSKSYMGKEIKALELPGLWNGAMSGWNTAFVEVPLETFNPVKVVLDLLRPAHQA